MRPSAQNQFWAEYLSQHKSRLNRRLHFIGTSLAFLFLLLAAVFDQPWFLLCAVISGYLFAWFGHFFIEKNRPATFRNPIQSLLADFRMFYLILNRKLERELEPPAEAASRATEYNPDPRHKENPERE